jgi:hypothetical protein
LAEKFVAQTAEERALSRNFCQLAFCVRKWTKNKQIETVYTEKSRSGDFYYFFVQLLNCSGSQIVENYSLQQCAYKAILQTQQCSLKQLFLQPSLTTMGCQNQQYILTEVS